MLKASIKDVAFTLHPETPIFHARGGQPGPKRRPARPPAPYTKDTLSKDSREIGDAESPATSVWSPISVARARSR
jgi:hypothetical protein